MNICWGFTHSISLTGWRSWGGTFASATDLAELHTFCLIHKSGSFFEKKERQEEDFPRGCANAAAEPSRMSWFEVSKEGKNAPLTKKKLVWIFFFSQPFYPGLIILTYRNWTWFHNFSFCPLPGNICVQHVYRPWLWQHLGPAAVYMLS